MSGELIRQWQVRDNAPDIFRGLYASVRCAKCKNKSDLYDDAFFVVEGRAFLRWVCPTCGENCAIELDPNINGEVPKGEPS